MWKDKKYRRILLACIFASLAAVAGFFVLSRTYIKNLVYKERLNQMEEITHQMFRNLEDVIGNRWADVDVQCNYLIGTDLQTDTDLYAYLQRVSALSNLEKKQITLLAVDSAGRYYTQQGSRGLLREMHYLEDDPEWVNCVTNSLTESDSRMVFLKRLDTPITLQAGTAQISLRYYGIAQSMEQLNTYFRCDAYDDHNSVYVLENNGLKLFNSNNTELLKGQNVYTVLSQMSYLHGSSFQQAKAELQENGVCYSNAVLDGTEYFYSLKQMENAAWTLAFLVPADDVATNTQKLVDLVTAIIIGFATVFSVAVILILWRLQRDMQRDALLAEQETNLRLESYNQQLSARNAELKRAQEVAVDALQGAERASKAKTDFLSNMSHDIRTPMNAIIGFTALAAAHINNTAQVQDYLKKISTSGKHLLSLINDVLDMSRIESGSVKIEQTEVHLPDVLHDLRSIIQGSIHAKQLELYIDIQDVIHEDIITDRLRLNQVLLNIVGNAIKFTPTGGIINIRVSEKPGLKAETATYEFFIRDNGIGMSKEFQEHIFDSFSRERTATESGIQGTGLGMAIARNIVHLLGGTITLKSAPGKGSEFTVTLECRLSGRPVRCELLPELKGARVLVVDDDTDTCMSISKMLRSIELEADWTTSGREAVLRAKEAYEQSRAFKVYIIDWLMPDMNGIETVRRIRRVIGNEAPIIILTAYDWADIETEAREAGVTAFVSKPLFLSDFRAVLAPQSRTERKPESVQRNRRFAGKRVLLVEDNELNCEIATVMLEELGLTVDSVEDGADAVMRMEQADAGRYDLIFMDIQMPRMDGYMATREIRTLADSRKANIPIIAMTANAFEEDKQKALAAGMNGHMSKPIEADKIEAMLERIFPA